MSPSRPYPGEAPYDLIEHRHRLAVWAAARAASRGGEWGVTVERAFDWIAHLGLRNLLIGYDNLIAPDQFDEQHRSWRHKVIDRAGMNDAGASLSHGKAAKLINAYVKVGVVCASCEADGQIPIAGRARIGAIHPPIDRILLRRLPRREGTDDAAFFAAIRPWSQFNSNEYERVIERLRAIALSCRPNEPLEFWQLEQFWAGH